MLTKSAFIGASMLLGFLSNAAHAAVVQVDFAMLNASNSTVASGFFTYDDSLNGVIGYGDLQSFFLDTTVDTYDLTFLTGGVFGPYYGMAYNTATQTFNTLTSGPFPWILAAILSDVSDGFFIRPVDDSPLVTDYPSSGGYVNVPYQRISVQVSVSPIPVPAALPLLASGLGALGFIGWRRKRRASVPA